jgi:hypothetical protein
MDSQTTNAGISLMAANATQSSYLDFNYAGSVASKGKIYYTHSTNSMFFQTNTSNRVIIDSNGYLGLSTAIPTSSLQVSGSAATTYPSSSAICAGYDPTTNTNPILTLVGGTSSAYPHIDFRKPGQTNGNTPYTNFIGRIACDFNNGSMIFINQQAEAFRIDGASANATMLIGTTTSQSTYKFYVNGKGYIYDLTAFNLLATGTKSFDIKHPVKEGYRLRHRCIEGPEAYLFYHFQYDCKAGFNEFELPDYFDAMNSNVLVYVSPYKHFGAAWGETKQNTLTVCCSLDGTYNIQVIGTRNDQVSQDDFSKFGVEYPEELLSQ